MKNIPIDTGGLKPKPGAHWSRNKIKALKSEKAKSRKEGKRASLIERITALTHGRPKSRKLRRLARILGNANLRDRSGKLSGRLRRIRT